jgi:hypothetical protein
MCKKPKKIENWWCQNISLSYGNRSIWKLQNNKPIIVSNRYAYLSNLEEGRECETVGRNLDAFSDLSAYSKNCNVNEVTNKTTKQDMHDPTYLKQTSRLQRNKNSLNMPITEKPSKIIPTIVNGKLFHCNNKKTKANLETITWSQRWQMLKMLKLISVIDMKCLV